MCSNAFRTKSHPSWEQIKLYELWKRGHLMICGIVWLKGLSLIRKLFIKFPSKWWHFMKLALNIQFNSSRNMNANYQETSWIYWLRPYISYYEQYYFQLSPYCLPVSIYWHKILFLNKLITHVFILSSFWQKKHKELTFRRGNLAV